MGVRERIFHAVLFEVLAVSLSIIGLALFTQHEVGSLSGTMIAIATIAMGWNYIFNLMFDYFVRGDKVLRSLSIRVIHVVLFEAGLLIFTIPVMAYLLNVSLWHAFVMDLGVTIFITIYAFSFNYIYDHCRARIVKSSLATVS